MPACCLFVVCCAMCLGLISCCGLRDGLGACFRLVAVGLVLIVVTLSVNSVDLVFLIYFNVVGCDIFCYLFVCDCLLLCFLVSVCKVVLSLTCDSGVCAFWLWFTSLLCGC